LESILILSVMEIYTKNITLFLSRFLKGVALVFCFFVFTSATPDNSQVNRADFVAMIAKNQPDHPFLPKNHINLSPEQLFAKTSRILKIRGFNVLSKKDATGVLTEQEFVRLTYALSGEPPGRNLFEQKLFLKKQGVVRSADVGIATGAEGNILQFHDGEVNSSNVKLASPVFMNDRIKTKSDSEATFTFDDKSTLTLGEKTNVSIKKHIYDPDKDLRQTVVHVALGTVRFVVTKGKAKGSSFKVVTPTAVAGVRGTEFVVTVDKLGKTSFIGISGSIETAPLLANGRLGKKAIVAKGQIQEIAKGVAAAVVKSNNGNAFGKDKEKSNNGNGKNKDKGNKGKGDKGKADKGKAGKGSKEKGSKGAKEVKVGKGKSLKLAEERGVSLKKAEKTSKNKVVSKESVQKPRFKLAKLTSKNTSPFPSFKDAKNKDSQNPKNSKKESDSTNENGESQPASKQDGKVSVNPVTAKQEKGSNTNIEQSPIKAPTKLATKSQVKDQANGAAKNVSKESVKTATKDVVKLATNDAVKTVSKDTVKAATKDVVKNVSKKVAKDSANRSAKEVADKSAKGAADKAAKDAADKSAKGVADKAAKDAADKSAKGAADKAAKDAADKSAKGAADKAAKDAADKSAKGAAAQAAADAAAQAAADAAAQAAADAAAQAAADAAAQAAADAAAQAAADAAAQAAADAAAQAVAQAAADAAKKDKEKKEKEK
jgi:hypothetical protein